MQAPALQSSSRNCSPAPDLVLRKLIVQCVFFSGGVFCSQTPVSVAVNHCQSLSLSHFRILVCSTATPGRRDLSKAARAAGLQGPRCNNDIDDNTTITVNNSNIVITVMLLCHVLTPSEMDLVAVGPGNDCSSRICAWHAPLIALDDETVKLHKTGHCKCMGCMTLLQKLCLS